MTVLKPLCGMRAVAEAAHPAFRRHSRCAVSLPLIALIGAASLFAGIAEDVVSHAPLTLVDVRVAEWFHAHATPTLTQWMLVVTHLHDPVAIGAYVVMAGALLAWKRDWFWFTCWVVTVPAGMALNALIKLAFQRARPSFADASLTLWSYSFPSGHVAGATLLYGVLAAMLVTKVSDRRWAILIGITAILLVALVALSRTYLLVHYLSDVVAAFAEAVGWLTLCLAGIHAYFGHPPEDPPGSKLEAAGRGWRTPVG